MPPHPHESAAQFYRKGWLTAFGLQRGYTQVHGDKELAWSTERRAFTVRDIHTRVVQEFRSLTKAKAAIPGAQ